MSWYTTGEVSREVVAVELRLLFGTEQPTLEILLAHSVSQNLAATYD